MKLKKLKDYPVRCSFCKEKSANYKIVGGEYGGRTTCCDCFSNLHTDMRSSNENSLAEDQLYSMYKI